MTGARSLRTFAAVAAASAVLLAAGLARAVAEEVRTVPSRPGVTQSFLLVLPAERPVATVVLFSGGNGLLGLGSGRLGPSSNFLIRTRGRFAEHGLLVAVVDAPSDRPNGLDGFRASAAHADDVRAVLAALLEEAAVPVWLVGTSMGSVSAADAAARLTTAGPDGLVTYLVLTLKGWRGRSAN